MFFTDLKLADEKIYLDLKETFEGDEVKKYVPSYSFDICLKNSTKIGFCNFRIDNSELTHYCGNIGYGIDKQFRGHKYSYNAVKLLLKLAKKHDLKYVLITSEPDNIASNKICEYLKAELIEKAEVPSSNEMFSQGYRELNIYKIELTNY